MAMRRTREQWAAMVATFERSKQSVEQFCAARQLAPATLRWWRWQLRETGARASRGRDVVRLVSVDVVGARAETEAASARIEISVSGTEIRFGVGADVDYVAALVASLRARC
jgi:hypothetical protein